MEKLLRLSIQKVSALVLLVLMAATSASCYAVSASTLAAINSDTKIPPNAKLYLPILITEQAAVWPDAPGPAGWAAAQVHKESCITAKHSKCWNPKVELKTAREYGFGLSQVTISYRQDGTERFNVFKELKASDARLRNWAWEDRYNPTMQLRAMLIKNKIGYRTITGAYNDVEHLAFSLAGYNGGLGGVLSDRRLCQGTRGCDPSRWFGHVERTSNKSRVKWQGYGQSPFDINRAYPVTILYTLRPQYEPYFKDTK